MQGTIKKIVGDKGFGFIKHGDNKDIFFHCSACNGQFENLLEGQEVTFEEGRGDKGPRAENVTVN